MGGPLTVLMVAATVLTAGAVLRVAAGVRLWGWASQVGGQIKWRCDLQRPEAIYRQ